MQHKSQNLQLEKVHKRLNVVILHYLQSPGKHRYLWQTHEHCQIPNSGETWRLTLLSRVKNYKKNNTNPNFPSYQKIASHYVIFGVDIYFYHRRVFHRVLQFNKRLNPRGVPLNSSLFIILPPFCTLSRGRGLTQKKPFFFLSLFLYNY